MIAAIMCGGKSTRFKNHSDIEKPLLKIKGITMIERIIQTLLHTCLFSRFFLITSSNTPKTRSFLLKRFGNNAIFYILMESGDGYSSDLSRFLKNKTSNSTEKIFVLPSDIPFIKPETIKKIICNNFENDAPFTTVLIEKLFVEKLGITPSIIKTLNNTEFCYSGISLYHPSFISHNNILSNQNSNTLLKENYIVMNEIDIAFNINTIADFRTAENYFINLT